MDARDWLEVMRHEYLDDFVREGGAVVKFVVPADEAGRLQVREGLRQAAAQGGFQFATVDASTTKLHLIDQLFHEVARQVEWDALAKACLRRYLAEMGFRLPDDDGDRGERLTLSALADLNDMPESLFHGEVTRGVSNRLYRDQAMSREFRLAMIRLCLAHLDPHGDPALIEAVRQWLRGELRLVSALKRALIFQRIARHNARHMLLSLAHWLTLAGKSGLVLALDIARYGDAARPRDRGAGLYYSTAACIDMYEVLRQLIDAADEIESGFVGVLAGPEALHDERRGLRSYQALYLRIADEVRDRYRPNARSALVRLSPSATRLTPEATAVAS
ncbi:MAG: ATP-binding protein [Chloroflexota bacterium]|nr:ATP-binding protein [Chloroflexota bacterium]